MWLCKKFAKKACKEGEEVQSDWPFTWERVDDLWKSLKEKFLKKVQKKIKKRFDKGKKEVPNSELSHLWKRVEKHRFPLSKFFKV